MINSELLTILNEIKEIEYSFRNVVKKAIPNRHGMVTLEGSDVMKEHLYGPVIGFLIYLRYKNILSFEDVKDKMDITNALSQSHRIKAKEILGIWNELEDNYPYIESLLELLSHYDFSRFQGLEQEMVLANWCNDKFILDGGGYFALSPLDKLTSLSVVYECQKQLGVNFEKGELLVIAPTDEVIKFILKNNTSNRTITFSDCERRNTVIKINSILLDCYSNISLAYESSKRYDVVIVEHKHNDASNWDAYLDIVDVNGCLLALGANISKFSTGFYENDIPLMLDSTGRIDILCRKTKDISKVVRYGFFSSLSDFNYSEMDNVVNRLTECIATYVLPRLLARS